MEYEFVNAVIMPIIHGTAGVCLAVIISVFILSRKIITDKINPIIYHYVDIAYTVFIALISIFPLLGMLGTVSALLTLDISGETELLKANFFQALNTTFYGIIYAVIFKIVNALVQQPVEARISAGKKALDDTEKGGDNE